MSANMTDPARRCITALGAPGAVGPYTHAVLHGDTLYCSGALPLDPDTQQLVHDSLADQTTQCLRNLAAVCEAAGTGLDQTLRTTIYTDRSRPLCRDQRRLRRVLPRQPAGTRDRRRRRTPQGRSSRDRRAGGCELAMAATTEILESLEALRRAHAAASEIVRRTPVFSLGSLTERCGGQIAIKAENLQRTGSFKLRGALAKLATLDEPAAGRRRQRRQPRPGARLRRSARGIPCTCTCPRPPRSRRSPPSTPSAQPWSRPANQSTSA